MLRASDAPYWTACGGFALARLEVPEEQNERQKSGVIGHEVAEDCALEVFWRTSLNPTGRTGYRVGDEIHGGTITLDHMSEATAYASDIRHVVEQYEIDAWGVERRLPSGIADVRDVIVDCFILTTCGRLFLWDFKTGRTPVQAYRNPQLLLGANAVLNDYGQTSVPHIHLRIFQPKNYVLPTGRDEWTLDARTFVDAMDALSNSISHVVSDVRSKTPTLYPGKQCKYCTARGQCPALRSSVRSFYEYFTQPGVATRTLSDSELGVELDFIDYAESTLKALKDGLRADAHHRINSGRSVMGWGMRAGRGARAWSDEESVKLFAEAIGVDAFAEPKLLSPNQLETRLAELGIPKKTIEKFYYKKPGASTLSRIDVAQQFQGVSND